MTGLKDKDIKNIESFKSKIIQLQMCLPLSFNNYSNNVAYVFKQWKFVMKINDKMENIYYEYKFYDYDVLIEKHSFIRIKRIHLLPYALSRLF